MKSIGWSFALCMLSLIGCATTQRAGAPKGAVDVIAHRGASAYAPENTLAAFRLAHEKNADWFELDCTLTKDGEIIVLHDDDLKRTTGVPGKVADKTLFELKTLDAGSWKDAKFAGEKLPTLAESLNLAKDLGIGVYIEVKNSDNDGRLTERILKMAQGRDTLTTGQRRDMLEMIRDSGSRNYELTMKTIELVRARGMKRQVVIQSFSPIVCAVALCEAPGIRTELLCGKDAKNPKQWEQFVRWEQLLQPHGFNPSSGSVDAALIEQLHREGKTCAVWTVNDEETVRRLAQMGVDSIITDKPDMCHAVLGSMGLR